MLTIFCLVLGVNQDAVNVHQDKALKVVLEHLVHKALEYGGGIDQAIQHNVVLVVPHWCYKSCLPLVPHLYPNEIISVAEVS